MTGLVCTCHVCKWAFFSLVNLRFLYSSREAEPGVFLIRNIHYSSIDPAVSFRTVLSVHVARSAYCSEVVCRDFHLHLK